MSALLVVEDDEAIREDVADLLRSEGYEVVTAVDGLDALSRLASLEPPCAILLDLMMPRMDGWQLGAQLQQHPTLASVPVVLVSGAGGLAQAATTLRASAYLSKPFSVDRLLAVVARYCQGAG